MTGTAKHSIIKPDEVWFSQITTACGHL